MTRSASPTPRAGRPAAAAVVVRGAALVAAALLLTGCSGQEPAGGADPAPASADAASSAAPVASDGASATAGAAPGTTVVTSMTTFSSPTGNISCYLAPVQGSDPYARCDLAKARWTRPEPEGGCDGVWGGGGEGRGSVGVGGGPAEPLCVGDTVLAADGEELAYGRAIAMGPLTCTSRENGMTCENTQTGHGFTARTDALDLF